MFITFEGIDGSGKSTLIPRVASWLKREGKKVLCTREPGGTEIGNVIRRALLKWYHPCDKTQFLLYMADRAEHVETVITPALSEGKVVLCDRYVDSTFAYQPAVFPIVRTSGFASDGLIPNLTILLDLSAETACKRIAQREGEQPSEKERKFLYDVRRKYHSVRTAEPWRIRMIDAEQDADTVFKEAQKIIKEVL